MKHALRIVALLAIGYPAAAEDPPDDPSVLSWEQLPALPDRGDYNRADLRALVDAVATESLPAGSTYQNGKEMARFSNLVHIADQLGAIEERDHFLSEIKRRLADDLGITSVTFSPCEMLSAEEAAAGTDYLAVMRANLEGLAPVLAPE